MSIDGGLRALFRAHLPAFMWTSIETGQTGRGIPDSEYCYQGQTGWIEYKLTTGWAVPLRPEQVAWLMRRARAGGRAFIACRRRVPAGPRRGAAVDEIYLIPGTRAAELKADGLFNYLGDCYGVRGPAHWYWDIIARLLTT